MNLRRTIAIARCAAAATVLSGAVSAGEDDRLEDGSLLESIP